jgi:hypothetical protein
MCLGNIANLLHAASNCPKSAGHDFTFTEGPVTAAGSAISNLWAETGTAVPPKKNSTVNVIDETPTGGQAVVMSCTVPARATSCSNTGSAPIAATHYLMVRINTNAAATTWRVSFRY